ncbi:MAG: trimethylamine methyltransferase family protein, partial [Acidimicrobiales bacterium]
MSGASETSPRARRGRSGHSRRITKTPVGPAVPLRNALPPYEPFNAEQIDTIERHADRILDEVGVEFRGDEEALELFRTAGARVIGERVRFEPGQAAHLCSTAPKMFDMHGRDGRRLRIGGSNVVFLPAYGPPFVTDLDRGRRYATLEDFENIVKLTYSTPWLHHSGGTVCEPVDVPVNKRHLDM